MRNDHVSPRPVRTIAAFAVVLLLVGLGCSKKEVAVPGSNAPSSGTPVVAPNGQQEPVATGSEGVSLRESILDSIPEGMEVPSILTAEPASMTEVSTALKDAMAAIPEQERQRIIEQALLDAPPIVTVDEGGEGEAP